MLAQQRHTIILDLLDHNGIVHTADLVKEMKVSSETIRKDLDFLEQKGCLMRVHGGAIPVPDSSTTSISRQTSASTSEKKPENSGEYIPLHTRHTQHMEQKTAITNYATTLIKEHQVVALDYGSTSQLMALALKKNFHSLTVITNSIQNAMILSECPDFTIILTGGIMNKEEYTLNYDYTPILEHLHIDILFMTVSGIDPVIGCTDLRFSEAKIQNQMRQAASKTIILADSSKFGRGSLVKICSVRDVDMIITDRGLSDSMEQTLRQMGTELIVVS